jgi:hypothetical protein
MMTALHIPTPPEDLPRSVGDALQSSGFADSYFLQKHVNRNRMPFAQVEFSARGYLSCSTSSRGDESQIKDNERVGTKRTRLPCSTLPPIRS